MTEKNLSDPKVQKEREQTADKMLQIALSGLLQSRKGILHFAAAMKKIRDDELWAELDYDNFAQLCCSPEISLMPTTVEKYIRIFDYWIGERGMKVEELEGIATNKLEILSKIPNPHKYFNEAKTMPFKDFRKLILEKEHDIPADDKEIEDYISRKKSSCPHWHPDKPKGKRCDLGKEDDLI